jgi:hypothetical protein
MRICRRIGWRCDVAVLEARQAGCDVDDLGVGPNVGRLDHD